MEMQAAQVIALLITGICVGFASGLLGVGGCFIMVPVQFWALKAIGVDPTIAIRIAFGTNLLVVLPTALSGAITHHKKKAVLWKAGVSLGIAGAVSALVAGGMLYATLSPKALIAAVRVLLGRRKGWVRTPKGRGRSGEGIDSYYALPIALYSVGAAASAVAAKALLPWNVALLAGTVLSLALEVKEEKG